ncbi:MAG: hypothetical protein IKD80_03510 [Selenomonadaceae bacterium]|nr:hypothetical protein [Selenomonadaceae bacterium]
MQVALATAQDADILICDEPTAGLDRARADKIIANLVAAAHEKNRTLIIITHDSNYFSELGRVELTAQKF